MGYRRYHLNIRLFVSILFGVACYFCITPQKISAQYYVAPKGFFDPSTCSTFNGWACDQDNYGQALRIDFYRDGPAGSGGIFMGNTMANLTREAAVGAQCGGNSSHGFIYSPPNPPSDGLTHTIYAYAINIGTAGTNPALNNSPRSMVCPIIATPTPTPYQGFVQGRLLVGPTGAPNPGVTLSVSRGGTLVGNYSPAASWDSYGTGLVYNQGDAWSATCTAPSNYMCQYSVCLNCTTHNTYTTGTSVSGTIPAPPGFYPQGFVDLYWRAVTPTPISPWLRVEGGDVYRPYISPAPAGQRVMTDLPSSPNSAGVFLSPNVLTIPASGLSTTGWNAVVTGMGNSASDLYDTYFNTLKNDAVTVSGTTTVGFPSDLANGGAGGTVFLYPNVSAYTLSSNFNYGFSNVSKSKVAIFLIPGSLTLSSNFTYNADEAVVFLVNGNITVSSTVSQIAGLFITKGTFNVLGATGDGRLTINGGVYANALSLNRIYKDTTTPTYLFSYRPKNDILLLPYLGKPQINWQEIAP